MLRKEVIPFVESNIFFQFTLYAVQVTIFAELIAYDIWKYVLPVGISFSGLVLARVGSSPTGHLMCWIVIALSALYIRLKTPWKEHPIYNAAHAFLAFMFIAMLVEGIWQVFYTTVYWQFVPHTLMTDLEILSGLFAVFLAGTYKLFDKRLFLIGLSIYLIYMAAWRVIGMPITLSLMTESIKTQYYDSVWVNLLEIFQWVIGLSVFSFAYRYHDI